MESKLQKLIKLARLARKHIEQLNMFEPDLSGACGLASAHLLRLANLHGIFPEFRASAIHCWIYYHGHIIDITATQFDESIPKIFVSDELIPYGFYYSLYFKTRHYNSALANIQSWCDFAPLNTLNGLLNESRKI